MTTDPIAALVRENMLLTRVASQGGPPHGRTAVLDRSATVLLARLSAQGPMTIAELAEAFDLDTSTVHRQVAAAMRNGLVERIRDDGGGVARKHRPTEKGLARFREELAARRASAEAVTADWDPADVREYVRLMRKFNESVEELRGHPWPR